MYVCVLPACRMQVQQMEYRPGEATWLELQSSDDATLVFESRFESGNLRRALHVRAARHQPTRAVPGLLDGGMLTCCLLTAALHSAAE
jgi:hypothetical protein